VVINLGLADAEYAVAQERDILAGYGIDYIHLPVSFEPPQVADFDRFCQRFTNLEGRRIFLHCTANKRFSVFLALYRIQRQSWLVEDAMAEVHRIWTPNPIWQQFILRILDGPDPA
jgi:protein tyrosine phosphatase (PTP) superfamily phosphohydrolase (DUF442 family)